MYRAYGLLPPGTVFDSAAAAEKLATQFPGFAITRDGDRLTMTAGDWEMAIAVNDDPSVRTESIGLAERIAGLEPEEAEAIESCDRRVEVWSDSPDQFLEHLADFQAVVGVLKSFPGVIVVDPAEHALM